MEWLSPDVLKVGSYGLVALFFILVFLGLLIPRWLYRAGIREANANASLWQKAYSDEAQRADLLAAQSQQLLAQMGTLEAFIRSVLAELPKGP